MRVIVVGLGVQGNKRKDILGENLVGVVDPFKPEADFANARDVPLDQYDAVIACVPDEQKPDLVEYWVSHGKHVLVEKPFLAADSEALKRIGEIAKLKDAVCYTAYNHRFEPHFVRMKEIVESGVLGKIYHCRMFYGNGTARLVRDSEWRDQGAGVLPDLGSHLLDVVEFWFGRPATPFEIVSCARFENRSPDHVVIANQKMSPRVELEMTLLMWRNHFTCDILAEKGSAHIESLCKWGPSSFCLRTRVLPSGRPREEITTIVSEDSTWKQEMKHFMSLCERGVGLGIDQDIWLNDELLRLSNQAIIDGG